MPIDNTALALDRLLWEFGYYLSAIANFLSRRYSGHRFGPALALQELPRFLRPPGLLWDKQDTLCEAFENQVTPEIESFSKVIKGKLTPLPDSSMPTRMISGTVSMDTRDLELCYGPPCPYLRLPNASLLPRTF